MAVEFVSADFVHRLIKNVAEARTRALQGFERMPPPGDTHEPLFWEGVLEANAARVLDALTHTRITPGAAVRYRFYENRGGDLRIRPFVLRQGSDASIARRVLEWHRPPDAQARGMPATADRDAELLYRHFQIERTAEGVFEYWFAMQEIWASSYWAHARVIASPDELGQLTASPDWQILQAVDHCAPAVVLESQETSHLAVLVYSRVRQESVTLEQVRIPADQRIAYTASTLVATGPAGYLL